MIPPDLLFTPNPLLVTRYTRLKPPSGVYPDLFHVVLVRFLKPTFLKKLSKRYKVNEPRSLSDETVGLDGGNVYERVGSSSTRVFEPSGRTKEGEGVKIGELIVSVGQTKDL